MESRSLLSPLGYSSTDCGYCKDEESSQRNPQSRACYYARSKSMTVDTYQALVDRGWRRSGKIFYKPDVLRGCCPHYTIRLPAKSFHASRDQRQAVNRWNRYVLGETYGKEVSKRFPLSKSDKKKQNHEFDLIDSMHSAEISSLKPAEPDHRFEVSLEPDTFSEEKFALYSNYQAHVHHDKEDEITKSGFKNFLCNSPLARRKKILNGKEQALGSWHQCYRLDGRLIAMAVLDLLPHAVSGVYFLYHSDYEKWSFGKLSALREIALAVEGGYQYYYMGYYIHNCVKMVYKGAFKPQSVLDPLTFQWHPLEDLKPRLDRSKFVSSATSDDKSADSHKSLDRDELQYDESDSFVGPDGCLWRYRSPSKASSSRESLFLMRMPGVLTAEEVQREVALDDIHILLPGGRIHRTQDLVMWDENEDITHSTLKGAIAELAACVGPEAMKSVIVDFAQ